MAPLSNDPAPQINTGASSVSAAGSELSIVIPVYNSGSILAELVRQLGEVLPQLASAYELILVNDGSRDDSWRVIEALCAAQGWVRGISLMRNYGQHNALLCGIRAAQYAIIVTMDDDLQHPPAMIARLLGELGRGFDVVYGRPQHEQHSLWRGLASRITKLMLQSAMGAETAQHVSAFRAFDAQIREAFGSYDGPYVSIDVLLTWGATRFSSVVVEHAPRHAGSSNYTVRKLITHALNMMTGFSIVPLQLASLIGIFFALFGVGTLIFVVGRYLIQGGSVPGFPFLASTIALFSGAQLFALGIIGEYLARVHYQVMGRPAYVVRRARPTSPPPHG